MTDIDITWVYEDSILQVKLIGDVDDSDFLLFDERISEYLDDSNSPQVHLIFDNSEMRSIPSIGIFKQLSFTNHPRLGWGVSFGDNNLTSFFMSTFRQVNWLYFHRCLSEGECFEFLQSMDTSLQAS